MTDMNGTRARWFIRTATIALVAGLVGDHTYEFAIWAWVATGNRWREPVSHIVLVVWIGGIVTLALGTDAWLRRRERPQVERVPHCGKCGHIALGLSEPRCPECAEAI